MAREGETIIETPRDVRAPRIAGTEAGAEAGEREIARAGHDIPRADLGAAVPLMENVMAAAAATLNASSLIMRFLPR